MIPHLKLLIAGAGIVGTASTTVLLHKYGYLPGSRESEDTVVQNSTISVDTTNTENQDQVAEDLNNNTDIPQETTITNIEDKNQDRKKILELIRGKGWNNLTIKIKMGRQEKPITEIDESEDFSKLLDYIEKNLETLYPSASEQGAHGQVGETSLLFDKQSDGTWEIDDGDDTIDADKNESRREILKLVADKGIEGLTIKIKKGKEEKTITDCGEKEDFSGLLDYIRKNESILSPFSKSETRAHGNGGGKELLFEQKENGEWDQEDGEED